MKINIDISEWTWAKIYTVSVFVMFFAGLFVVAINGQGMVAQYVLSFFGLAAFLMAIKGSSIEGSESWKDKPFKDDQ